MGTHKEEELVTRGVPQRGDWDPVFLFPADMSEQLPLQSAPARMSYATKGPKPLGQATMD